MTNYQPVNDTTYTDPSGLNMTVANNGQTLVITLPDTPSYITVNLKEMRVCKPVEVEALDMPDAPGWWAFEGRWTGGEDAFQTVLWVCESCEKLGITAGCDATELDELTGKWYRLSLPWEPTAEVQNG